jgi:hypothetical protein
MRAWVLSYQNGSGENECYVFEDGKPNVSTFGTPFMHFTPAVADGPIIVHADRFVSLVPMREIAHG